GALCRVADLLQYISRSVLVGYMTGAATLIMANQMVTLLGVGDKMGSLSSSTFAGMLTGLVRTLPETDWVAVVIGLSTVALYLGIKKWFPRFPAFAFALLLASAVFGSLIHHSA